MCQTRLWVRQMASVIDTDPFSFMKNSLVSSCSIQHTCLETSYPNNFEWVIYSAFGFPTSVTKREMWKENWAKKWNLAATGFSLRLFTSSLLSQDLVNIEGIVPLKNQWNRVLKLISRAKIFFLMNFISLKMKERSFFDELYNSLRKY